MASRLILCLTGPGFKSRLSRFFSIESVNFNVRCSYYNCVGNIASKSPWCSGLHVGFASNRSRVQIPTEQIFFPWEFKLQCKIFDITILFVVLFLFFFKAVPTQSQPSIYPFFDVILFYFFTKLPTMVGSKSLNLFKMEREFSKFAHMGLNLSNSIHTCPNWSKLVQIGLN